MNIWMKLIPSMFLSGAFVMLGLADQCFFNAPTVTGPGHHLARLISLGIMITLVAGILISNLFGLNRPQPPVAKEADVDTMAGARDIYKFLGIGHNFMEWSHDHRTMASRR